MRNPEYRDHEEANEEADERWDLISDLLRQLLGCVAELQLGDFQVEDKKRHGDRDYAVAQGGSARKVVAGVLKVPLVGHEAVILGWDEPLPANSERRSQERSGQGDRRRVAEHEQPECRTSPRVAEVDDPFALTDGPARTTPGNPEPAIFRAEVEP